MQLLSPQAWIGCCGGLSFSCTELIFSGKMPLGTPKKRVKSKKSFHLSLKKSGARVTCNCSARKHESAAAAGWVFRVQSSSFQERCLLVPSQIWSNR
jgi:hypothetical protein